MSELKGKSTDEIIQIFKDNGMTIELGANYSVKGQIAQLLNGCAVLMNTRSSESELIEAFEYIHRNTPDVMTHSLAVKILKKYKPEYFETLRKP